MNTLRDRHFEYVCLLLILALAAYVRLANNADNPSWYTDEGTHLAIAQSLAQGRVQYLAIIQSTLLFAKLPLFERLLACLLLWWGGGMGTLRVLTGALGVLSVGMLYGVARRITAQPVLALLAALMLAIYPQAVLYSRFGFSYNLLTPLVLLTYLGAWEYLNAPQELAALRRSWLAFSALTIGLGGLSDLWVFALLGPLVLAVASRHWRDVFWSVPLALLPFGLYALAMLHSVPDAFLFDLRFTLSRLSGVPLWVQAQKLALNYTVLMTQDPWPALAMVGFFLLRPARLRYLSLLFFLLPLVALGRTEALFNLSMYYMIPLLPFVSLGVAAALLEGVPYMWQELCEALISNTPHFSPSNSPQRGENLPSPPTGGTCQGTAGLGIEGGEALSLHKYRRWLASLLILAIVGVPFVVTALHNITQAQSGFSTIIDPFLIDPHDAKQAAAFVNARAGAEDVVIASPGLAWLIDANAADFQMAIAATGRATPHMPGNIPPERWAFDPDYTQARFVVVDNLWYTWGIWNVPGLRDMLEHVQTWELAFAAGEVKVYRRP